METTKVITGVCKFSYANLWEPKAMDADSKAKYSVSLIIPKSDTVTIDKIRKAIQAAYDEGKSKLSKGKSVPSIQAIKTPLRDGDIDRPDDEAYRNSYFVNANSTRAPQIVDRNHQEIIDKNEIYSGIYGRASINFYAYNSKASRGIACGLQSVQKIRDGESLTSISRAEDDFNDGFIDDDFLS